MFGVSLAKTGFARDNSLQTTVFVYVFQHNNVYRAQFLGSVEGYMPNCRGSQGQFLDTNVL